MLFNVTFLVIFCSLLMLLVYFYFKDYQRKSEQKQWHNPFQLHCCMGIGLVWILNDVCLIVNDRLTLMENICGLVGGIFFAALFAFYCYPKMNKEWYPYFMKRYGIMIAVCCLCMSQYQLMMMVLVGFILGIAWDMQNIVKRKVRH